MTKVSDITSNVNALSDQWQVFFTVRDNHNEKLILLAANADQAGYINRHGLSRKVTTSWVFS